MKKMGGDGIKWNGVNCQLMNSIVVAALIVIAGGVLIGAAYYPWSGDRPSPRDAGEILAIYDLYMETGQDAYVDMLGQKLKFVARDMLGLEVEEVFLSVHPPGREREDVCGSFGDVPFDLAKVRQAERYQVFMGKYSGYPHGVLRV